MKIFLDFLALISFFIFYKIYGIYAACIAAMVVYSSICAFWLIKYKKLELLQSASLASILVLGGLTLFFHNATFFKIKPTVIYWLFALAFGLSPRFGDKKYLLERILADKLTMARSAWAKLNHSWMFFFILLGAVNLILAYFLSTDNWVMFKTFGTIGLMLLFGIAQAIFLSKQVVTDEPQ